jgi:hypothetical protein
MFNVKHTPGNMDAFSQKSMCFSFIISAQNIRTRNAANNERKIVLLTV